MSITGYEQDDEEEEERVKREWVQKATPEKIAELRERHLRMYRSRLILAKKNPGSVVNELETTILLRLWEGMAGKTAAQLSETERAEVLDALSAGE